MQISNCVHQSHDSLPQCVTCGAYISKSLNLYGLKTKRFNLIHPIDSVEQQTIIKSQIIKSKTLQQIYIPENISDVLGQICERHNWSLRTEAIGIFFYSLYYSKNIQKSSKNIFKYICMCLYLASKVEEHNIPKGLKKYRKECDKCFTIQQYMELEAQILEEINFDFNISTFIDVLHCHLSKGVTFSNERPNIQKIENKVLLLAKSFIRNGSFLHLNQQHLAAYIIYKARNDSKCQQVWNWPVESYTKINVSEIKQIYKTISLKNQQFSKGKQNCQLFGVTKQILGSFNRICIH